METGNPDSVSHVYQQPGKYIVELKGTTDLGGCVSGAEQSSIKVIYVNNPRVQIAGPRSVCPFSYGVPYFVSRNADYINFWFAEGGILSEATNDTILIDWGDTNNNALIKVISTDAWNCVGDTVFKKVKVKDQLEPDAPMGPDSLCADDISGVQYQAYLIPGTTYQWFTDYGRIDAGQGSRVIEMHWESYGYGNLWFEQESVMDTVCKGISDTLGVYIQRKPDEDIKILVEKFSFGINEPIKLTLQADSLYQIVSWKFLGQQPLDSVPVNHQPVISYNCPGTYRITVLALDTAGLCFAGAEHSIEISVSGPLVEIIQVSHEDDIPNQLVIRWKHIENTDYAKPYFLNRDGLKLDSLIRSYPVFTDTLVKTDESPHSYQISTNEDCPAGIESIPHRSIWLFFPDDLKNEEDVVLEWNEYEGWTEGIEKYEIWMSVDNGLWTLINENAISGNKFIAQDLGFEHCFKIRGLEMNGNQAYSWSNINCKSFVPELYPYNIITPNGDGLNDVFIIENIEHYPDSRLTIFNRWGKKIYETTGYLNNWGGLVNGEILLNSTYFYTLELNESRAAKPFINGVISVLR
jgi:gliding motility-associated-like protein